MTVIRQGFDEDLQHLQQEILKMGDQVVHLLERAFQSLINQDSDAAKSIIEEDPEVDRKQREIEYYCIRLFATQQPVARDLRWVASAFKIVTDLERMADHAVDIAKTTIRIGNEPFIKPLVDLPKMAEYVQRMVRDALKSYLLGDIELAYRIAQVDNSVDHLHKQIFTELLLLMAEDPNTINQAAQLLFVIRNLERIADYATNIGEEVIFLRTGEWKELND
jgi:phosphate transport system protein